MAVKSRITPWKKEEDEDKEEKLPKSYGRFSGWSEEEEEEDVIFVPQEEKVDSKKKEKKPGVFKQISDWAKRTFTPGVTDTSTGEFHPAPKEGKDYTVRYTPGEYVKQQRIESVYSSRTPEGVKHSAEIEIAEIDQKLLNLEAQRMDFARYLTRKVKPIEKRTPEERKAEEELYQKMEQIKKDYMGDTKAAKYTTLEDFALKVLDPDIYDLKRSKEKLEMVIENQDTGASNNLVKVLKEAVPGLKDIENIPAGFGAMFGLLFQIEENVVSKKIENGEKLTPDEEVIQKRIIAKREYEKRDISDLQAGAQGIPGSLSMSIDFLLLGGAGAGLKGIPKYLALAQKATKVAFSTQLPTMFSQFADRVGDEYETKPTKDGGFELIKMGEGEVPTTAAILSIADVWSMAQAEVLGGEILDDALGFVYKPLAKKFPQIAMSNTVKNSKAFQVIKNLYSSESLKEFVSRQSPLGELFEEFVQSQIEKLTHGQPLGLTGAEAKRITVSTLLLSLIMAPLGLADLPRGESKKITSKDLEKFPEGIRNEIESGLQGKETIDKDDLKVISEDIVKKIETGEITIEGESEKETETLYSAQKGEIVEKEQAYKKVKEVDTDQVEILREFVKEGDAVAKELLYGKGDVERTKIDYAKTDYYIQKKLSSEYEAIKYNNANTPIKGVEYHDLKENRFYATSEDAAKLYKNQTRGEKYNTPEFKEFAKKVDESLAPPVVKKEKVIKPKEAETKKSNLGWVEIKNAKPLEISGFKVYSHKGEDGGYTITEATSGLAMATGKTLKEAKANAQAAVDRYGVKVVKERIAAQVKELGSRPDEKPYMRIRTQEDIGNKEDKKTFAKDEKGFVKKVRKENGKTNLSSLVEEQMRYVKKTDRELVKMAYDTINTVGQDLKVMERAYQSVEKAGYADLAKTLEYLALDYSEINISEGRLQEIWKNMQSKPTQKEKVKETLKEGEAKTIKQIAKETKILEPNIRRILGVGTKEGEFERVADGVYTLTKGQERIAYIQAGDAKEELPKLAQRGFKADMIFLDIPYKTAGVIGGNRGIDYDKLSQQDFEDIIVPAVKTIARDENSPIVYMYSNSKTGMKDMVKYNKAIIDSGLQIVAKGTYTKTYKDGTPMKFGKYLMPPEGILIFNKSGKAVDMPSTFDIKAVAPLYKGHYQTEKAESLLEAIIKGTTKVGDTVLDPFAGSGVTPEQAVKAGRKAVAIEIDKEAVEKRIIPRVEKASKEGGEDISKLTKSELYSETIRLLTNENIKEVRGNSVITENDWVYSFARSKIPMGQIVEKIAELGDKKFLQTAVKEISKKPETYKDWVVSYRNKYKLALIYEELRTRGITDPPAKIEMSVLNKTLDNVLNELEKASKGVKVEGLVGENQKKFVHKGYEFITTETAPRSTPSPVPLDTSKKILMLYGQTEDGWTFVDNKNGLEPFTKEQLDSFINKYKDRLVKSKTQVEEAAGYEEIKKKMKKRLTPEEAAEAQRLIDEEVKGIPGASVEMADSEASQFFGKLKELRNSTSLETKIEAAEEAVKEFSPALARDHEFTPEEVQARTKRIQSMSAIDLTDIVSLVNNLSEKELLTIVKKFRSPGVRGMFRPARGEAVSIDILASLFYDPAIAAKTVAHEIGHFVDFLPDNRMAGTFASKIAGVKSKAKNFGEFKDAVMREEIYTLSKDVWRPYNEGTATEGYIQYRKSGEELYADFISMVFMDPNLLKKEAPVTMEAWIAFLDNKPDAKVEFEEAWDLMLESGDALYDKRLKSIREMFKTGDKILWGAGETEELSKRNKLSYKLMDAWQNVKLLGSQTKRMVVDVKTPLIEIEAKAQKRLGRKLTTEEKISKQVESLQKIQAQEQTYVDTYYDPIYQRLKAEGLEWEDLGTYQFLNRIVKERGDITPQEALESLEGISVMDLFSEQDKKNPLISRVLTNLERKETDTLLTDLIEDSVKSGESISVVIEKLRKGVFETLFGTIEPKTKSGAYFAQKLRSGMLAERLSLYLPMKAGIANPLGFTTQTSLDQLAYMEKKLGTKKYNLLKDVAEKDFRAGSLALLKLKSAQHYFGARKIEKIIQNEAYATFAVNHYLSKYIPAQIRQQSGTLKGVANVADATILKNTSMLRAMEHNEMRRNAINFILTNDPTQIQAAPTKFDSSLGVRVLDLVKANKMKDWSVLYYMENGNLRQVMVTNEVYNAINERILENNFVGIKVLELLNNKYYRPLFVGYNLAFNVYNVQRDFLRFWKNSSWLTFPEAIYYYAKAVPSVAKSVFNKQDSEVIKEMKEKRMLGFYRNDVYDNPESEVSNGVFKLYETEAGQEKAKGVKEKTQKLLETISNISQTIEMIPKVAGKMSIDKKQVFKTDAEARDMIINYLGSPNFQNKGELYKYYNNIFLFSNAVKEGWRGDINVLVGNTPTGRKGSFVAMLRMVESTAVPVMLGFLIRHGLPPFDDDDKWGDLRELLEKIPKRDFVSFIPIPVGELGGKTVYIPVARAETDQLLAQIIWSLMDGLTDQPGGSPGEEIIDAFASEFPSINPLFTAAGAIITTASGGNPYDSFRGRNVFSPFTFDYMSGQEKAEILVEYLAGVSGLNVFIRTYDPRTYGEDSSPLQKAHQLPIIGNVIYRLLRESNYGIVETEWDTQREQNIQSRQEKQSTKKMMNEDAKQFISQGASSKEVEAKIKEYQELAVGFKEPKKGYSGSDLTTANNVRKMFKEELLKESGVLPSWRILDMTKNSQKEAELARQQERMSQTEFINYLRNLRMAEAISDTFVESLYKNGYISKDNYKKVVSGDRKKIYMYQ